MNQMNSLIKEIAKDKATLFHTVTRTLEILTSRNYTLWSTSQKPKEGIGSNFRFYLDRDASLLVTINNSKSIQI